GGVRMGKFVSPIVLKGAFSVAPVVIIAVRSHRATSLYHEAQSHRDSKPPLRYFNRDLNSPIVLSSLLATLVPTERHPYFHPSSTEKTPACGNASHKLLISSLAQQI